MQTPPFQYLARPLWIALALIGWLPGVFAPVGARAAVPIATFYRTALPKPTGSYAVGYEDIVVVDRTRVDVLNATPNQPRRLPVHFWYPASASPAPKRRYVSDVREVVLFDATPGAVGAAEVLSSNTVHGAPVAKGKFPLVLFSPGYGFAPELYQVFAEQLAANGYVVAAVHSPGVNGLVTLDGELYETPSEVPATDEASAALNDYVIRDLQAVLAQIRDGRALPSLKLGAALDLAKIGVFGHSFGGSAAVRLAGRDATVLAAVDLDGTIRGDDHLTGLATNALFLLSGENSTNPSMDIAWAKLKGRAYLAVQKETKHITFSDFYYLARATEGKAADQATAVLGRSPAANLALTRALLVAYFNVELKGSPVDTLAKLISSNKTRITLQSRTN